MKQHIRETEGKRGHGQFYCDKCDEVFLNPARRQWHDMVSDCVGQLLLQKEGRDKLTKKQRSILSSYLQTAEGGEGSDREQSNKTNRYEEASR